jgi:hypothetical protein
MFTKAEKVAIVISGIEIIGCFALSIYCYGKAKFYEGRISKYNELRPVMDALQTEIKNKHNESKEEA